jgi:ABC-2 type transport system permease protein
MVSRKSLLIAGRVFKELRRDYRTMFLFILSPTFVLILLKGMMGHSPADFNHFGLIVTGLFPTAPAFLFSAFVLTRDYNVRTLEHLLTTPVSKLDVIIGYVIAFILPALVQISLMLSVAFGLLGLRVSGKWWEVGLIAIVTCVLGLAIGLMVKNFARNEFQLTKILAMIGVPHLMISGFFRPPSLMVGWMAFLSHFAPWRYGVELLVPFEHHAWPTAAAWFNFGVIVFIVALLFAVSSVTVLNRRTA